MKDWIRNNRGSSLLITLMLIVGLLSVTMMATDRSTVDINLAFNQLHKGQAFYIAEAGANRAVSELRKNFAWRDGFTDEWMGPGMYTVTLLDSATDAALADSVVLIASANVMGARATVEVWVAPGVSNPFRWALFTEDGIAMRQDACTDSYNSDSGTYAVTVLQERGDIG